MDHSMRLCREVGCHLATPRVFLTVPDGLLVDEASRATLIRGTEDHIQNAVNASMQVPIIMEKARANADLVTAANSSFPGVEADVAIGMAMRFYAGFLEMAKIMRKEKSQGKGLPDIEISPEERGADRAGFAHGVRFAWFVSVREDKKRQELVLDGISAEHQELYLPERFRRLSRLAGGFELDNKASVMLENVNRFIKCFAGAWQRCGNDQGRIQARYRGCPSVWLEWCAIPGIACAGRPDHGEKFLMRANSGVIFDFPRGDAGLLVTIGHELAHAFLIASGDPTHVPALDGTHEAVAEAVMRRWGLDMDEYARTIEWVKSHVKNGCFDPLPWK